SAAVGRGTNRRARCRQRVGKANLGDRARGRTGAAAAGRWRYPRHGGRRIRQLQHPFGQAEATLMGVLANLARMITPRQKANPAGEGNWHPGPYTVSSGYLPADAPWNFWQCDIDPIA